MDQSQRVGRSQTPAKRPFIIYIAAAHSYIVLCATSHRNAVESLGVTKPGAAQVMIAPDMMSAHEHYEDGECVRHFAYDHTIVAISLQELWSIQSDAGIQPETI